MTAEKELEALKTDYNNLKDKYDVLVKINGELIKKATPRKLYYEGDGYDNEGNIVYDTAICNNCGRQFETYYDEHVNYCPNCGQALDWTEEEEEDDD